MKFTKYAILPVSALLLMLGTTSCEKSKTAESPKAEIFQASYMDSSVNVSDDFYRYCVGNWLKKNEIPSSEEEWGSFQVLSEENKKLIRQILEETAKSDPKAGSNAQKIKDFYVSGMDSVALNKDGVKPLEPYFAQIAALKDKKEMLKLVGEWTGKGMGTIYSVDADQDMKKSTEVSAYYGQSGTTLPEKDYYFSTEEATKKIRAEYVTHISKVFQLLGDKADAAAKSAEVVLKIETDLAKGQMARVEMRDPKKLYNKMTYSDLNKLAPEVDWVAQAALATVPKTDSIIVSQPNYFKGLNEVLKTTSIEDWKTYLRWQLVAQNGKFLSDDFVKQFFSFNGTVLSGVKENKPRWERVMRMINSSLGEALGEIYVAKAFKPEAKERMVKLVSSLQGVFKERIQNLDWMSAETKKKAIVKLEKIMVKIGYPDKWRDYSKLEVGKNPYVINVINARGFEYRRRMNKIGKPVDRTEWGMSPQTINAYYNPSLNEIVFPAAILQPPFFDLNADDALVYGGIGAVIGHEMTHGFDDEGRKFDADGNLNDWWAKEDEEKFSKKANMVKEQFNAYTVIGDVHVNGELTLGENLADLGGIMIALDAFKRTEQGKKNEKIAGMTAEQRFFWAWANVWKSNCRDESMRVQIKTDPHSPNEWRSNGPVTNLPEFYKAFDIKESGKMFRPEDKRVKVW